MNDELRDESLERILAYDRRRYWLENGWSVRFRVREVDVSAQRPHGLRYSFTLHDADNGRLLGFDNAHGLPRVEAYDHRHRFRRTRELVPYDYIDADRLIGDFFDAVIAACGEDGVAPTIIEEDLDLEDDDAATQPD